MFEFYRGVIMFPILMTIALIFMYTQVSLAYLSGFGVIGLVGFLQYKATMYNQKYKNEVE